MLDAADFRRVSGRGATTSFALHAAAARLAGGRCGRRRRPGRPAVLVPLDAAAVVLGVSEGDLAAMLEGARGEGDEAGAV